MDRVLALSIPLAEEGGGKLVSCSEGGWVCDVTEVHHLVSCVQSLEAPLVFLPKVLMEGRSKES